MNEGIVKMTRRATLGLLALAAGVSAEGAWAQSATPDAEGELRLSPAQRDLIYSSIANQTHVSTAAPSTWAAKIGDTVPQGVDITPLPATIAEVIPQVRGYGYAFVAAQVLIVKTEDRKVVEIIAQKA